MKFWMIERELESGGSVAVGLTHEGIPYYTEFRRDTAKFADELSATRYMAFCIGNMKTYEHQKEFKVVQSEI